MKLSRVGSMYGYYLMCASLQSLTLNKSRGCLV